MTENHTLCQVAQAADEWGPLYIADEGNERSLHFSKDSPQSSMWLDAPFDLTIEYTQLLMASLLFMPSPRSALLFGLGGGSIAKFLWKTFPKCHIHAVEIRPTIVKWAHQYFHLPHSPRIHTHICDALQFAAQRPLHLFDLIVVDLFTADGMSPTLAGQGFFEQCQRFLDTQGVIAWNVWQSTPQPILEESIGDLCTAFGKNILALPSKTEGNLTLIALPKPKSEYRLSKIKARANALSHRTHLNFPFLLRTYKNFGIS